MYKIRLRKYLSPLLIIVAVIIVNAIYITGYSSPNPLYQKSGLLSANKPGLLRGLDTIDPNDGYTSQALGHAAARTIRQGQLPWWNYNEQVGAPMAGEMQSAALFPLVPLLGLQNGLLYMHIVMEIIAGLATYYLLKRLKLSELASLTGGILFAVNGTFSWLANAAVNPVAFLPLLLLGIEVAFDRAERQQKRGWLLLALALGLSLYSGFPETAYLDGLLALLWSAVRLFQLRRGPWKSLLYKLALGSITGLALAAPILVAFASYFPYADVGMHAGSAADHHLAAIGLPALLFPYMYGPIFGLIAYDKTGMLLGWWGSVGGYVTLATCFLAIIGFTAKKWRPLTLLLAGFIVVSLGKTYGLPVISQLVNLVPGISSAAFYRYIFPTVELSLIILAAIGFDGLALMPAKVRTKRLLIAAVIGVLCLIPVFLIALHQGHNLADAPRIHRWMAASVIWGIGCVAVIAIGSILVSVRYARLLIAGILIVDAMLMFAIPELSAPRSPQVDIAPVNYLRQNIGQYRFYSLGPIAPNYGSYYGLASINTNDLPIAKDWAAYVSTHLYNNVDPILFTGTNEANPEGESPLAAFLDNVQSYEEVGVKYIVVRHSFLDSGKAEQTKLQKVFSDRVADIYQTPNPKPYFEIVSGQCQLHVVSKEQLLSNCSEESSLLRRELYMPGWQASTSRGEIRIDKEHEIFQSITLPKGSTKINFSYQPQHIKLAYLLFMVAVLVVGFVYGKSLVMLLFNQAKRLK